MEIFDDLKLVRCPRSLAPTLVTLPSMSLIPFAPFSASVFQFSERAVFERFILQPDLNPLGAENETGRAERPTSWEARSQDVELCYSPISIWADLTM